MEHLYYFTVLFSVFNAFTFTLLIRAKVKFIKVTTNLIQGISNRITIIVLKHKRNEFILSFAWIVTENKRNFDLLQGIYTSQHEVKSFKCKN